MSTSSTDTRLTASDVAEYLREHPSFFTQQADLLAELELPHESGDAISLVERQVSILRERNIDMRTRLNKLLDNARENDKLFDKTKRLVLALLEGQDLGDHIDSVYYCFDREFGIPHTSILLYGDADAIPSSHARVVRLNDARQNIGNLVKSPKSFCGQLSDNELAFLFGESATAQIGSVAVAPLIHGTTFGLLAIGHPDPNRYRSSMGTLFLSYIAEVLNRLLPKHLGL